MWSRSPRLTALLCMLCLLLCAAGCQRGTGHAAAPPPQPDKLWSQFIAGHTAGTVSRHAHVLVHFSRDLVAPELVGQSAAKVLNVDPAIPGTVRYTSPRDIELTPEQPLVPGRSYRGRIDAAHLGGLPAGLKPYEFDFRAMTPDFEVKLGALESSSAGGDTLVLHGTLETADGEEPALVEKILSASFQQQPLNLEWAHFNDNRTHYFSAAGIARQKQAAAVHLAWSGKPLGLDNEGQRDVEVPQRGSFEALEAHVTRDGRQSVRVSFSDVLDPNQNLKGLVRLGKTKLDAAVEGNALVVYPLDPVLGSVKLQVEAALRNAKGARLGKPFETEVIFVSEKPQVRFAGEGVVLPDNEVLSIPFEGMNVRSVQVTAFQVFDSDIGQFLQSNKLGGDTELHRVGRYLWRKTIQLPDPKADQWTRYALDATELLRAHPGSLFRLSLSINRKDSSYNCPAEDAAVPPAPEEPYQNNDDLEQKDASGWDGIEEYYDAEGEGGERPEWKDRTDPCKDAYFRWDANTKSSRNFLGSNLGLLAKRGAGGALHVVVTSLRDAMPVSGAELELRNFQNQPVGKGGTDAQGFAEIEPSGTPFYLIARAGGQVGYLKLNRATALPTSHFDTGGETVTGGIKGFIYGERGVWRPGDDIYLDFILEDKAGRIPENHPVTMQLFNPKGQLVQSAINAKPLDGFYAFTLHTAADAPTGNWTAKVLVGGAEFGKPLKIETVMPNHLKMDLQFTGQALRRDQLPAKGTLNAQWLTGASAAGLKADVAVKLTPLPTTFSRYGDYVFDDPTRSFSGERETVFEDKLDGEGKAAFDARIEPSSDAPGMLQANFSTRVFEDSGAFSIGESSLPYHPYARYIGIKLPKGDPVRGMLLTDQDHTVEIASVDPDGKPVSVDGIEVSIYQIGWKWWWDQTREDLTQFSQASYNEGIAHATVATKDGRGSWKFQIKYPAWGRYLVRACDHEGGHCSGKVVYIDWPGWAGRAQEQSGPAASALSFFADKAKYTVGDTATIQLPDAAQGRALLTVETGSRIIDQKWIEFTPGKTRFDLPVTAQMSPNAYVSLELIQPHHGKQNDRPIRLYGIIPLEVSDPATQLQPQIKAAEVWRPNGKVKFEVSERGGQEMTYTVAVVDEGLLGLTSYKTPDPHAQFYKREALGVLTWDLFDEVAGAYGGELERLLALGGDSGGLSHERQEQKRFPPVVRVLGPFHLAAGASDTREIELPQYDGAVRIMVVAGHKGAYGAAEKSVIVREPVTILPTLPRVLGPGESLRVPVAVFTFEPDAHEVKLGIEAHQGLATSGDTSAALHFDKPAEKLAQFSLQVGAATGTAEVKVQAESGAYHTQAVVHVPVRAQNPPLTQVQRHDLAPGEEWTVPVQPVGVAGTNLATLEISSVPPFDFERRLDYLITYPNGCVEQTTSSAFPQLYLNDVAQLDEARRKQIDTNIQAAIERLRSFQTSDGGFSYWPGTGEVNVWASNYAGHFLVEARRLGYHVPDEMLDAWLAHQRQAAAAWTAGGGESAANQSYRLLTLALADHPDIGAMNRLREAPQLGAMPEWQLAEAYAVVGMADAGRELMHAAPSSSDKYENIGETLGSELRDQAIRLHSLVRLGNRKDADPLAESLGHDLATPAWYSTQSTAYGLMAMAGYVGGNPALAPGQPGGQSFSFAWAVGEGALVAVESARPMTSLALPQLAEHGGTLRLRNTSQRPLHLSLVQRGSPPPGQEQAENEGLDLSLQYSSLKGAPLAVDKLPQGSDFVATVTVRNRSGHELKDLALSQVMASGWEIHNPRFEAGGANPQQLDYQDIRDDRVLSYFGLANGESRSFKLLLNAAYLGRFYLPATAVESMYEARFHAHSAGQWVEVVKPQ